MTDMTAKVPGATNRPTREIVRSSLKRRYAAERRFKFFGLLAVCLALAFLAIMLGNIVYKGHSAFIQTNIELRVHLDESIIDPQGHRDPKLSSRPITAV